LIAKCLSAGLGNLELSIMEGWLEGRRKGDAASKGTAATRRGSALKAANAVLN
jgi:hypothetical protein